LFFGGGDAFVCPDRRPLNRGTGSRRLSSGACLDRHKRSDGSREFEGQL
jgi:hypothetical protein